MVSARTNSGAAPGMARIWPLALLIMLVIGPGRLEASEASGAAREFQKAKAAYARHPESAEAAWQFGRACFDLGEASTNKTERAEAAEQGIAACREALATQTNSAPLHYYLALNLGELAQTRGLSALKLVGQMEQELLRAVGLEPGFDHAGPERTLGMLYRDAPAIASVGNRTKARQHLVRAVQLAPNFPENRLELIQAYIKWNERPAARNELRVLEQKWTTALADFAGEKWAADRADWEAQLQKVKKHLDEPAKLESPRH